MPEERTPATDESMLSKPLERATRFGLRYPVPVIAVAVAAAVLAVFLATTRLGFRTSRLDLLNPNCQYNQLWLEYINEFGDADDVVIVVEGESRDQVVPVLEEVSAALAQEGRLFRAVLHGVDLTRIRSKGLHYLEAGDLLAIEGFLDKTRPIFEGDWGQLSAGTMAAGLCQRLAAEEKGLLPDASPAATAAELGRLGDSLLRSLGRPGQYQSPWPEMPWSVAMLSELNTEYLLANQGQMGFVLLRLVDEEQDKDSFTRGSEGIDALRRLIGYARKKHPEVAIGLTGLPVMENDEMRSSQSDMNKANFLALLGVALMFIAGFGCVRHPLLTIACLALGMAWTMGFVTLAVGHLNILSAAFGAIMIGLGIDYGVHLVARYFQLRRSSASAQEAILEAMRNVGPGTITAAVSSGIAFGTAMFTEFTGIAELGIITAGSVILCCIAEMFVLPPMILLMDRNRPSVAVPEPLDMLPWLRPLFAWPRLLLVVSLVATVCLAVAIPGVPELKIPGLPTLTIPRLTYDHNLLHLQADGLESVKLEQRLLTETDQSVWFALSIADDRRELLARKARFLKLDSVQRVEEIASLFPTDSDAKAPIIERIRTKLAHLPERPPRIPVAPPDQLGETLARAQAMLAGTTGGLQVQRQLELVRDVLRRLPEREYFERLDQFQHYSAGDLLSRLHILRNIANPEPPKLTDLPESLVTRFVGRDGKFLLKIYARGSIWDMEAMDRFVRDVRSVDPRATGNPLQTYEASRQMQRSYQQAAVYALTGIVIALFLDFRSVRLVLLSLVPLALGMTQLFGIMSWMNMPLSPANMIVLPLLLGLGVDNGVHMLHDFRRQTGPYRLNSSIAMAMLLCSLTTMAGFGSLMIAEHRGLQSFGRVMTIGVGCCMFTSLIMLPAFLIWITRNRPAAESAPSSQADWPHSFRRDAEHSHLGATSGSAERGMIPRRQTPGVRRG